MAMTKSQLASQSRYKKKTQKNFLLTYHKVYDADVIDMIEKHESKSDYIRQLVRADINKKED